METTTQDTPILNIHMSNPDRPEHEELFLRYAIELIYNRERMIKEFNNVIFKN